MADHAIRPRGRPILAAALTGVLLVGATTLVGQRAPAPATVGEEFDGPFSSWADVKAAYGAVGDGQADDTAALARAFASLSADGRPVLYVPPGTYRITNTLTLAARQNVSIVGADPGTVSIVWDGPTGGTMVRVNAVAYARLSRFTFDGRGKAAIAIDQSAGEVPGGPFDTGNEYADDEFRGVAFGIHGGFEGRGFAETSIVRDHFVGMGQAGVALGNFNALDIWIRDSLFDHCAEGVTNDPGAGNFRVYDSLFRGSTVADLAMQNTGLFTARGNYSTGSKAFFISARPSNQPANLDIQHNVVLDTVDAAAIRLGNQGPGVLLDNVFRSRPGAIGPVVAWQTTYGASVASVGNTFTVATPLAVGDTLVTIGDRTVAVADLSPPEPTLPPHPRQVDRPVVDVPGDADGAAIQAAITRAATAGPRAVVHIAFGRHPVADPIEVPAGDLQIVGDGYATVLAWAGSGPGPVVHVAGPTRATIRDLTISGGPGVDGLVADGIDQPGARVWITRAELRDGAQGNLFIDRLRDAAVDLVDFGHAGSAQGPSVRIVGAPAGRGAGRTVIYSGASSNNSLSYDVSGPVTVLVRDSWYEGGAPATFAHLHGGADVTFQGARVATPADTGPPAIAIENAGGQTTLLNLQLDDRIALANPGAGDVLAMGLLHEIAKAPYVSDPGAESHVVFLLGRQRVARQLLFSPGTAKLGDLGRAAPDFVQAMLALTRAVVSPPPDQVRPAGVTDLRLDRLWCASGRTNLVLRR